MSFLRHDKTYRSDVGGGVRRSCVSSSSAAGSFVEVAEGCLENANGERSANRIPRLSFTMSLGSAIPWRVALRQGPTPLQRPASMLHQSDETVKRPPMRGGNFRPPTWGIFNRRRQVVGRHRPWATGGLPRGFPRLWPAGRIHHRFRPRSRSSPASLGCPPPDLRLVFVIVKFRLKGTP